LPNISIDGVRVTLNLGREVSGVSRLPGIDPMLFDRKDGSATFRVPRLETLQMFAVAYG
jgi:hypothetical protein